MAGEPKTDVLPAGSYVLDEQIGFILRQVSQRHTGIFVQRIGDGLTPMQWAVMSKLLEIGQTSQSALGRTVFMDAATIKGTVDRLEARSLVVRVADADDRRKLLVDLTEAGREITRRNLAAAAAITQETLAPLDEAEIGLLRGLLERLR
ncbi:MAG TPA: MarR family transcriptional regulator [Acidisoma sp.]|jgi:DNA-binding MarR family transcriptional regulator|uniref:MarR family winged helix-turn-helix transcriptional regulator n=1 Tax=Acidisoma sp. TaxID=1872115 RepID=UPI002C96D104|nr:MarR family transcriptional regulator [Acidisoma sp.]HTI01280.1 MarR family transcriptional regulator [Acidisoma sp.]